MKVQSKELVQEQKVEGLSEKAIGMLPNARTVCKAVGTMAVATLAIEALSDMTVSAGPVTYALCVAACDLIGTPAALPMCVAACMPTLGPWCP